MVLISPSLAPLFAPNVSHVVCKPSLCIWKHFKISYSIVSPCFPPFPPVFPRISPYFPRFSVFPVFPRVFGDLDTFGFGYLGDLSGSHTTSRHNQRQNPCRHAKHHQSQDDSSIPAPSQGSLPP